MSEPHLLIHDFDGTLYPFPEDVIDVFSEINQKIVEEISRGALREKEARDLGFKSYMETGLAFRLAAEQMDMHLGEAAAIHHRHAVFDLEESIELIRAYKATEQTPIVSMILTQGTRCNLDRHLPKLGLSEHFPKTMWLATDDTGFEELKAHSYRPWLMAKIWAESATGLTFKDKNIHVFEDTANNLIMPHKMGWNTVFVHHGKPLEALPDFVHRQDVTPADRIIELAAFTPEMPHDTFGL